ncbi:bifunctional 4-hydroxy-2-oxoglutarate aldolase/2-dehydro-3-deoxy-phosphogluconate aldolase [Brachybacterium avium]|uniref:bifunctional 4-hydroxy-2-oxoglutarate aldolase/2-dehydro-3-deoxy-phosphogluconate aldolase n=1 Tax=Brachybacterium avium TaxID=2017485 RepID=UPI001FE9C235|nr:bifunctional 4-hydroxy-2-oxoglutarate aldolase/2-dehydro-3-deoxy-phosphogluconate aldolase [Brachybacterium avium]
MAATHRPSLPERTAAARLIVVIRGERAEQYAPVLEALADAGIRSVELTLSTPGTLAELARLHERFGTRMDIGVGTVTDPADLRTAAAHGADFIVTPITRADLLDEAAAAGIPIVPGGLTPSELHAGWSAGAAAVKVFPASVVGPGYVKDLRGPSPASGWSPRAGWTSKPQGTGCGPGPRPSPWAGPWSAMRCGAAASRRSPSAPRSSST